LLHEASNIAFHHFVFPLFNMYQLIWLNLVLFF
jgi:hypothetical protein